jgi:L-arabinonolactonase
MRAQIAVECRDQHGEGVFWSRAHALLYWTDILGERVWTYSPTRKEAKSWATPGKVCCFATRKNQPWHSVVAGFADGFAFLDLLTGARETIAAVDASLPENRLNDGRTDRQGRLVAGGMNEGSGAPTASVWRLDPDLRVSLLFAEVACANGICFSPEGATMWFADSPKSAIEAFDYDGETGVASRRRAVAAVAAPGIPDGSCVDAQGFVWNAVWEGSRVVRYAPDGRVDRVVEVPVRKPTCCAFGGEDLATLYITSSRLGETETDLADHPMSGCLFAIRPGVSGLADAPFVG